MLQYVARSLHSLASTVIVSEGDVTWAYLNPDIIVHVLSVSPRRVAYSCTLVNRHWFNVVMGYLWRIVQADVFRYLSPMRTVCDDYYAVLVSLLDVPIT